MNADNLPFQIPSRYWGYLCLSLWGVATLLVLRHDAYNLNEGAAKSLLLVWSIADQVASSVVTFGAPDLRTLLFMPVGFLWTGSVVAAKVFTILLLAFAAWLLHLWQRDQIGAEGALLATGLLLVSPLTLEQIDTLSPGVYLLLAFALGAWLDSTYRAAPRHFGGWYFAQLFVCTLAVSLHPAGLAYPAALLWSWHKAPLDRKQQKYFFAGVGGVTLLTLIVSMGWRDLAWLQNPLDSLATIALGSSLDEEMTAARWVAGGVMLTLLFTIILKQYRNMWASLTGRILLLGLPLGATTCDSTWSVIAFSIMLYFGLPLLLHARRSPSGGFARQRGGVMLLLVILFVLFTQADRRHYEMRQYDILSTQDQLIKSLADEAASARRIAEEKDDGTVARLRVASQWPSRTMIACKCDTLPLPPAAKDPESQLAMLHSITHLLFNPQQPGNMLLSRNLAPLGGSTIETVDLQRGGALLRIKEAGTLNPGMHR